MSAFMFWSRQSSTNTSESKNSQRSWLHSPESLLNGHIVYPVKFFGNIYVQEAKGIEVVKDAIRRMQFTLQMKKSETGNINECKKVEITISVDGIAIQDRRSQSIFYQFRLHDISYCADEEGDKNFFCFIANSNSSKDTSAETENRHECFIFIASKLASDITLTIGQAFDLAYRRFITDNVNNTELAKAHTHTKYLEGIIANYKLRLREISNLITKEDLEDVLSRFGVQDICEIPSENMQIDLQYLEITNKKDKESIVIERSNKNCHTSASNLQYHCKETLETSKKNGRKADELLINSDSDSDFDPRADENQENKIDAFYEFEPSIAFGQQLFFDSNKNYEKKTSYANVEKDIPAPLLPPPPKPLGVRRVASTNNTSEFKDLFGSMPFSMHDLESINWLAVD